MKRIITYTIVSLLLAGINAYAQEGSVTSQLDSIILGNSYGLMANGNASGASDIFERSPEIDIAKALYGQFSGLLVKQGTGRSEENQAKLRLHGHSPLVLVDGFPRELDDITGLEIESIEVLKDAASLALYGVKGANGVINIKTKRGKASPLHVTAKYQYGIALPTRTPEFSDAYTYAYYMNQARELDGLPARFSNEDLNAFYAYAQGSQPNDVYAYPNVNWWDQIYRSHGDNHRADFTFTGGNLNFRYFAAVDYMKDDAMYIRPNDDDRYNAHVYDNRLGIRANVDVNITETTAMKIGVMARLSEFNTPNWDTRLEKALYKLPASAFPVKHADGTYGGNSIYGNVNPVAQLFDSGQHTYNQTKVLADMTLRQDLGSFVKGLSAEAAVAFDYIGKMTESATKEYQYAELVNGNLKRYGTNSKIVEFSHWFNSLRMKFELNAHLDYKRSFGEHTVAARLGYRQRSWVVNDRNESSKSQEFIATANYNWKNRVFADAVVNYAGSAYLAPGHRFNWYPALSVAGIVSTEPYIKVYASGGLSGSDGDLYHELWRQAYGSDNGHSYNFNTAVVGYSGRAEGSMAALTLAPEQALTLNAGVETKLLSDRLTARAEAFYEDRTNILVDPSNISGVLGIDLKEQSVGESKYKGFDLGLDWNDKAGEFEYGVYGNAGWLFTEVVDDGQAFQQYEYLYHKGNPVSQYYGLEVIGYFKDQTDINNSPRQTFGDVRPGDLKYKDQNGDGVIDNQDRVKMFGSSFPMLQYGFGLNAAWKGLKIFADFQGITGVTLSLLDSPLYQPIANNSTISDTFLSRETPWTPENADKATMPRLTSQSGENNYRTSNLWLRDGSFLKLRNLGISYNIPKSVLKICDATVSLNGTNLFSIDNIGFADPEQLGAYYPTTRVFWAGVKFNF